MQKLSKLFLCVLALLCFAGAASASTYVQNTTNGYLSVDIEDPVGGTQYAGINGLLPIK